MRGGVGERVVWHRSRTDCRLGKAAARLIVGVITAATCLASSLTSRACHKKAGEKIFLFVSVARPIIRPQTCVALCAIRGFGQVSKSRRGKAAANGRILVCGKLRPSPRGQYSPYRPRTDAISLALSYPTPSRNVTSTCSISAIRVAGSPFTTIRSAFLPGATVPIRSARPR